MLLHHLALLLSLAPQIATLREPPHQLIAVEAAALRARPALIGEIGIDHASRTSDGGIEFAASADERTMLRRLGVPYRVVIDDLETFYASRLSTGPDATGPHGMWLTPPFASGAMGGYYTFTQVESVLDQLAAQYPAIVTPKVSLGATIEGRQLWMIKISDNPGVDENEPEMRIESMHHAREPESMQVTLWMALWLCEEYGVDPLATYLVNEREFFFVPVVNPDGYVYNQTTNPGGGGMWRKNRRANAGGSFGVDPNRNWPEKWGFDNTGSSPTASSDTYRGTGPASEPEIAALVAFCNQRNFSTSISGHTHSNLWLYSYGYAQLYPANNAQYVEISTLATEVNHYQVGPPAFILYLANGVTTDWEHNVRGTMSWTPEIGSSADGFWPPTQRIIPLAEENLLAYQRTALAAGAYVRPLSVARMEVGDGDGFFEAGESVEWRVVARNSGRMATNGSVSVGLASASPDVQIVNGSVALGSLAAFSQLDHAANPLRLAILAGAQGGAQLDVDVTITAEGYTQTIDSSLQIGEPIPFLLDTAEVDLGWTKGIAGDTATTGLWVRGDPIGTNNSGQPCNPENDATPAPGVNAFVTGNGGGAASTDDVDNGATTLLSPVFDLSNVGAARLSYQRWYADFTSLDDVFAVSISNDGGANWTPLENVSTTANAWTNVSFLVGDHLPQTDRMRLRFVASDTGSGSLVEAAIDDLKVEIYDSAPRLNIYGQVVQGGNVRFNVTGPAGAPIQVVVSSQ
ncbi:MAG: M14 family zinc carboxypeptidase, partial [Planctomycetota bacterium]